MFYIVLVISIICAYLIMHSYVVYPLLLKLTTTKKSFQYDLAFQPPITILFAAYNEEKVIEEKLASTIATNYPLDKISILVGSDASSDKTNEIVNRFADKYPQIQLINFAGRTGKAGIINKLAAQATTDFLILTDANVIFEPETIHQLIAPMKDAQVAQVGGNIVKRSPKDIGIATQEKSYIARENNIKLLESIKYHAVVGCEGGCYAIRKANYAPVPPLFFMDDFYITLNVIEQGKQVVFNDQALCLEDVPTESAEEYKRKIRISIGNFQNLNRYKALLKPYLNGFGYAFLSHKVLRWYTPFFLIALLLSNVGMLLTANSTGQVEISSLGLFFQFGLYSTVVFEYLIPISAIKFAAHFVKMNAALLHGFVKYKIGVSSNIWQPTQRNK